MTGQADLMTRTQGLPAKIIPVTHTNKSEVMIQKKNSAIGFMLRTTVMYDLRCGSSSSELQIHASTTLIQG